MLTESCAMFFSPSRAVLSAILRDEYLTSLFPLPSSPLDQRPVPRLVACVAGGSAVFNPARNLFKKFFVFCFILLFTSSSPYRKADQFAVSYFSTSLIALYTITKNRFCHLRPPA